MESRLVFKETRVRLRIVSLHLRQSKGHSAPTNYSLNKPLVMVMCNQGFGQLCDWTTL